MAMLRAHAAVLVAIVGVINGLGGVASAATYPVRPMEYVIPFGPGGGTDLTLRLYKDKVEKLLGQPIIMTYKPGAGGVVAGSYVTAAKPDGHTVFAISNTSLVTSILARKAPFTLDDIVPVCTLTLTTTMLVVRKESPFKTLKDLIEAARTQRITYSTTAAFSAAHLIVEAIGRQQGFEAKAVPMGGGSKAMLAALGGHVDMAAVSATGIEEQMRILAVNTMDRWPFHPEVPTLRELGYPSAGDNYFALFAPKGTPAETTSKIYDAYKRVLEEDKEEIMKRARSAYQVARIIGPEALGKVTRDTHDFFKSLLDKMEAPVK